jgi:hypothetical protein
VLVQRSLRRHRFELSQGQNCCGRPKIAFSSFCLIPSRKSLGCHDGRAPERRNAVDWVDMTKRGEMVESTNLTLMSRGPAVAETSMKQVRPRRRSKSFRKHLRRQKAARASGS